ncbi:hypothetical protein ACJJI3_16505 [Microbulbifer sp. ZKSA004]|uniref:hypothetical protein n=2 Tax=Microbulbifer TaxID=48073 RepID=UPI00403A64C4
MAETECTEGNETMNADGNSRLLTIAIHEETLAALLAQRYLHAEELHCLTPGARRRLHRVLLRSLIPEQKRKAAATGVPGVHF